MRLRWRAVCTTPLQLRTVSQLKKRRRRGCPRTHSLDTQLAHISPPWRHLATCHPRQHNLKPPRPMPCCQRDRGLCDNRSCSCAARWIWRPTCLRNINQVPQPTPPPNERHPARCLHTVDSSSAQRASRHGQQHTPSGLPAQD